MTTVVNTAPITLDDKYTLEDGRVFMSGTQALVRLALVQIRRDRKAGFDTGGFISGYRGSPLGNYDNELWRAKKHLSSHGVVFQPGINEDLAATAVWGSQQVGLRPGAKHQGVFGIWYGKGPGLDRSMDVFKHANAAGTSPYGGVLAIVGDDHGAKSSTLPHQSDHNFKAAFMPFLYPASVDEYVEYGLLGLAMSRFSGCWVGFKATADTVETSATVDLAHEHRAIIIPDFEMPQGGLHIRLGDVWREEDTRLQRYKGFAALAFAKANKIDRLIWDSPNPRFGIISTGKSYADVVAALAELGIDAKVAADIGLRLYKVGMPWPLEPDGVRAFCEGLEEVLVVEEKREFIEHQLKWQLFNWREDVRPRVVGKQDEKGAWLLSPDNELSPGQIAHVIAARLSRFYHNSRIDERLAYFDARAAAQQSYCAPIKRDPYFCSGCPHNSSTKVPEGSRALAGIGCHIMALWMDRSTDTFTHMGGEGVTWVGEAPFTNEEHIFINLGDGTYFHSGLLAIRQAVAAKARCTYKILYNDAVAMTGGQNVDGELSVQQIARQLASEGVARIMVVSEMPERFSAAEFPAGVTIHERAELETVQRTLRDMPGVTALIYDQTCAAEKRRRRKRGQYPDPDKRIFINSAVCEGCGDCSVQSNCVSVEPMETELGRKRRINQSSCNKDFSCVKGFCPSFVELAGAKIKKPDTSVFAEQDYAAGVPLPALPALGVDYNIFVTGIGGTGVLTVSALLGMAAHLAGKASVTADMTGMAQKGGAVYSHVRLGQNNADLLSPRIISGGADLLLACDSIVAAAPVTQDVLSPSRSAAVINASIAPTAEFVRKRDLDFQAARVEKAIRAATNPQTTHAIPADLVATALLGDAIATNMMMMGYAWQQGYIPLDLASIMAAIKLNGVAVGFNIKAFSLGRLLAHDTQRVLDMVAKTRGPAQPPIAQSLEDIVAYRVRHLTGYQDAAYAALYQSQLVKVIAREQAILPGSDVLSKAVAQNLAKLMAYKDEYEVARLYSDPQFTSALQAQFEGDYAAKVYLAPPLLSKMDPNTGRPQKQAFGPWIFSAFKFLAKLKVLRGGRFDIFGYTHERRTERALIQEYLALLAEIEAKLAPDNFTLYIELARLPEQIRGFGPVKEASIVKAKALESALRAKLATPSTAILQAAE
jgi:indolepyruvate ferredoxin oxidoreductase